MASQRLRHDQSFPGDQTQFSFFEVKEDCFGNPLAPVARNATWSSTDPSVATCDATGMATGQLPGFTYIQGRWRTFLWDLSANNTCTRTVYDALAEALCDVLISPVEFTRVTAKTSTSRETSAQFEGFGILNANLDDPDCPGADRISIIVSFLIPHSTESLLPSPDTRVTLDSDNKYLLVSVSPPELIESLDRGFLEFTVRRRSDSGGTSDKIIVRIAGRRQDRTSFTGTANIHLICAY